MDGELFCLAVFFFFFFFPPYKCLCETLLQFQSFSQHQFKWENTDVIAIWTMSIIGGSLVLNWKQVKWPTKQRFIRVECEAEGGPGLFHPDVIIPPFCQDGMWSHYFKNILRHLNKAVSPTCEDGRRAAEIMACRGPWLSVRKTLLLVWILVFLNCGFLAQVASNFYWFLFQFIWVHWDWKDQLVQIGPWL